MAGFIVTGVGGWREQDHVAFDDDHCSIQFSVVSVDDGERSSRLYHPVQALVRKSPAASTPSLTSPRRRTDPT
jgi:hypothetical protein